MNEPAVHRFTKSVRAKYGLPLVRWNSRLNHRLAITDLYMDLGMPADFVTECRYHFLWRNESHVLSPDAFTDGMFIEVQRNAIRTREWAKKRRLYELYLGSGMWERDFDVQPEVVVLQTENQQPSTIGPGIGYRLRAVKNNADILKPPHQ